MEPEVSLPCTLETPSEPYTEPDESSSHCLLQINFNIILTNMPESHKGIFPSVFPT